MLAPDERTLYSSLFSPPPGFDLDYAIGTTFTLDLRTLLVLPLTLATRRAAEVDDIDRDPVSVLESVRSAAERIAVFSQHGRIHVPPQEHPLYSLVEPCIVPVRARTETGVFHPKVWVMRFSHDDEVRLRAVVLSRNLTFDRSWDFVLALEGAPWGRRVKASYGLADLVETCPSLAVEAVSPQVRQRCEEMSEAIRHTRFEAPAGFQGVPYFHALGLDGAPWRPGLRGKRVLVVSPFVSPEPLAYLRDIAADTAVLISRDDELSRLPAETLATWDVSCVADDAHVSAEVADDADDAPSEKLAPRDGLHAKMIALEHGRGQVTWWLGSANATSAAWEGRNVELVVELTSTQKPAGIDTFLNAGFGKILAPYQHSEPGAQEILLRQLEKLVESARDAIVNADLRLRCAPGASGWSLELSGDVSIPDGVRARVWPVTLARHRGGEADPLRRGEAVSWTSLSPASLTRIVTFELVSRRDGMESQAQFALQLPCTGMPEGRDGMIVRSLVQNRDAFLRYLRFLLAGDDLLAAFDLGGGGGASGREPHGRRAAWDEVFLEELVRAASRDPQRLARVERLVEDLLSAEDGEEIVPREFLRVWRAVRAVASKRTAEERRDGGGQPRAHGARKPISAGGI